MFKTFMFRLFLFACLVLFAPLTASAKDDGGPQVSSGAALKALMDGNERFTSGHMQHPFEGADRRKETSDKGQKPFAMLISCADSRVPLELSFDRGIGDLFISRVAGNAVSPSELGTLEYGADHLHIPLLVVLGHTKCGAVTAVYQGDQAQGNLKTLLQPIQPAVESAKSKAAKSGKQADLNGCIYENVLHAIEDIHANSPALD